MTLERLRVIGLSLGIAVITVLVYLRVLSQDFVDWDDSIHTYANPHLTPRIEIGYFWRHSYQGLYIPLSYTYYALIALIARRFPHFTTLLGGHTAMNPHVFHAANLLLHLANVLLCFALLRRLTGPQGEAGDSEGRARDWACAAAALLFALHPIQTEAVAWISEARGLLGQLFSFGALLLYLRRTRPSQAASLVLFLLALLAKPSAASLPLVALALDWGVSAQMDRRPSRAFVFGLTASAGAVLLTRSAQAIPVEAAHVPVWQRPLVAADSLAFYLKKLVLPLPAGPDYGRTPEVALSHGAVWTWIAPAALLALCVWARRRSPIPLAAYGAFLAALLPVLGLTPFAFQRYSTVADRYLYPAMIGPVWLFAAALAALKTDDARQRAALATAVSLTACAGATMLALFPWDNAYTFTAHALEVNPRSWILYYNRGNLLADIGKLRDAEANFLASIAIKPDNAAAHLNLSSDYLREGRFTDGEREARLASADDPDLSQASYGLGFALLLEGKRDAAIRQWQDTVRRWPVYGDARYNLAIALLQAGRRQEAIAQLEDLTRRYPSFQRGWTALAEARKGTQADGASSGGIPRR